MHIMIDFFKILFQVQFHEFSHNIAQNVPDSAKTSPKTWTCPKTLPNSQQRPSKATTPPTASRICKKGERHRSKLSPDICMQVRENWGAMVCVHLTSLNEAECFLGGAPLLESSDLEQGTDAPLPGMRVRECPSRVPNAESLKVT